MPIQQNRSIQVPLAENQYRTCAVPGCRDHRNGLTSHCKSHRTKTANYGHPLGHPLKAVLWTGYRTKVTDLLARNSTHEGQIQAVAYIQGLLDRAKLDEWSFPGASELNRLRRAEVTALDILTEVCAVYAFLDDYPENLPDSDRARDFAISRAVFSLAVRPRRPVKGLRERTYGSRGQPLRPGSDTKPLTRPKTSALEYIGSHLRQTLPGFLTNVKYALETVEQQKAAFEARLSAPLSVI